MVRAAGDSGLQTAGCSSERQTMHDVHNSSWDTERAASVMHPHTTPTHKHSTYTYTLNTYMYDTYTYTFKTHTHTSDTGKERLGLIVMAEGKVDLDSSRI